MLLGLGKTLTFGQQKIYPYATGGDYVYLYEEDNKTYRVHEFLSTGTNTLNVEVGGEMEYLIVAGGGGGGDRHGGGGGGGGFLSGSFSFSAENYTITVGEGGTGGSYEANNTSPRGSGAPGSNSSISGVATSYGGGGGGTYDGNPSGTFGSGGGGGGKNRPGIAGTVGQGNSGGSGLNPGAGGGGGASSVGGNANNGSGGDGKEWPVGSGKYYAGGGGGAWSTSGGPATPGGTGGGGAGAWNDATIESGSPNTGGGGGGSRSETTSTVGRPGGSGIVIVRYVIAEKKLWTPSELTGLQAWWDVSDESTLFNDTSGGSTPTNGEGTARWEDKSGNSRTLSQITSSERPTKIENEVNGLSVLRFANDRLDGSPFMYSLGGMTFAIVYKSSAAAQSFLVSEGSTTTNTPIYSPICSGGSSSTATFFYRPDNGTVQVNYLPSYNWYSWNILTLMDSGSDIKYTGDGGAITSLASSYTRSTTTLNLLRIGELARGVADQFPNNADIGEIIVFDSVLSTADRQRLEGYLAHKWGLTNNLPAGHPYKYEPPYKVEPEEIVTDGLVLNLDAGDYASYPRSGTTWYDLSGGGNNGTLTNGPTYDSANKGSIVFDGSNDYVDITNINLTGEFTLSCWLNISSLSPTARMIFGEDSGSAAGNPKIGFSGSSYFIRIISTSDTSIGSPALNTWEHFTITRNSANKIDLYRNAGSANRLFSDAAQSGTYTLDKIGVNGSDNSQPFNGKLNNITVYNRALSSTEITQNFNALRGRYGI